MNFAHIALISGAFTWRGAHKVMANLAVGFAGRGHRVTYLTSEAGTYLTPDLVQGVEIVDFGTRGILKSGPAIRRWLSAEKPAVLLSATEHVNLVAGVVALAATGSTRVFASCHNVINPPGEIVSPKMRVQRLAMAGLYPRLAGVIAVSSGVANSLSRVLKMRRDRIDVIYNPVVTPAFEAQRLEPPTHPFLAEKKGPVLLAAGSLTWQKGFDNLIDAVAVARQAIPVRAIILGEGPDRATLESKIAEKGLEDAVALPGYVPNPAAYMEAADLFVLSSRFEGFGLVIAEALAVGTPVVSTDCPAGPSEILKDGRYGRLVRVGDAVEMGYAIAATLSAAPSTAMLVRRGQSFSLDAAVNAYLDRFDLPRSLTVEEAAA